MKTTPMGPTWKENANWKYDIASAIDLANQTGKILWYLLVQQSQMVKKDGRAQL